MMNIDELIGELTRQHRAHAIMFNFFRCITYPISLSMGPKTQYFFLSSWRVELKLIEKEERIFLRTNNKATQEL